MGTGLSFPIGKEEVCYLIKSEYASTGKCLAGRKESDNKWVGIVIKEFIKTMLVQRAAIMEARQRFLETDYDRLRVVYPFWSTDDVIDIKSQFQSFDRNHDGLIDFEEMVLGLDELGDKTTWQERKDNFKAIDADDSGAVDFEEYLEVLAKSLKDGRINLFNKDVTSPSNINKLTVVQQIEYGLF